MKTAEEVMEILEAFDVTGTRAAQRSWRVHDHKTVPHWVRARE